MSYWTIDNYFARFWHLFITKNKNHTHVMKVGTPQNFCLAFIDELITNY